MRVIPLSHIDNELLPDALLVVLAHAVYPEDAASREQVAMVWRHERQRIQRGGQNHSPAAVARLINTSLEKRAAKMALVGYTAIILTVLHAYGHPMSLKRAARIMSDFVYRGDGRIHYMSFKDGAPKKVSSQATGDIDDIERTFASTAQWLTSWLRQRL